MLKVWDQEKVKNNGMMLTSQAGSLNVKTSHHLVSIKPRFAKL